MKILVVTEKCGPDESQRDGGAKLVGTLQAVFGPSLRIMQFGPEADGNATWHFPYPNNSLNRFERRVANALFIAQKVKAVAQEFTHLFFVHISMQFGIAQVSIPQGIQIWTFPMFLTPSYIASGEVVPLAYQEMERMSLLQAPNILTPSHLEKRQLIEYYAIPKARIHVVPRGVDTAGLVPEVRSWQGPPRFCSIGSIKPQKNTLGLVRLFAKALQKFPGATLRIIGPLQNTSYGAEVQAEIQRLGLQQSIEMTGYLSPPRLATAIKNMHLHISASTCETFGRSIFETLASGIPNLARATGNAAREFLEPLPYIRFVDDEEESLVAVDELLTNLPELSSMAMEIGKFYDDQWLSRLLAAKIGNGKMIAISDFDGTLFHKDDPEKTKRSFAAFQSYPLKVVCSARPIGDLLQKLASYNLEVDWIIGLSGSSVATGDGRVLWSVPLAMEDVVRIEESVSKAQRVELAGQVLQLALPVEAMPKLSGLRHEVYQGMAFLSHWEASKFRAVHRLLRMLDWSGQVRVFGDGPYDVELLTYFDGIQNEVSYV